MTANDDLISATDVGGGVTSFTYDSNQTLPAQRDRPARRRHPRDVLHKERLTSENSIRSAAPRPLRTSSMRMAMSTTYATYLRGNQTVTVALNNEILSITRGYGTPEQATWTYTYDPTTQEVTSITAPNGTQQLSTWDALGNRTSTRPTPWGGATSTLMTRSTT